MPDTFVSAGSKVQLIHKNAQTRKTQANCCLGDLEVMAQIAYHELEIAVVNRLLINVQNPVASIAYTVNFGNQVESLLPLTEN